MTLNQNAQNHLAARAGFMPRWLLWVAATDKATGDPAPIGIWDGDDQQSFIINGQSRPYFGAQGFFEVDPLVYAAGTFIRTQTLTLSGISAAAEQLVRGYRVRFAPAELHLALFDPRTENLIDTQRRFKGFVNRSPIFTPAVGGVTSIKLELASSMRTLTRTLALKKSDESQQRRSGDRFRKYGSIAGTITTKWGE